MNTSPYVDPRKPSQEVWEEFSMSFTPAVQEVVDFAKRIPGFRELPENDQVSLLKAGTFEVSETQTLRVLISCYGSDLSLCVLLLKLPKTSTQDW